MGHYSRSIRSVLGLLLCWCSCGYADQFAALALPIPTGTTATGQPSAQYWQQQADYQLTVELIPESDQLMGQARISYHNNSPQALDKLWFELPLNRFQSASISSRLQTQPLPAAGVQKISFYDSSKRPLAVLQQDTFYRVELPKPLLSGQQLELEVNWTLQLPERKDPRRPRAGVERLADGSALFGVALWFPRAVAFTERGWALSPFIQDAEFATETGNYDVSIKVPAHYLVLASGELSNPQQVLSEVQWQAWQQNEQVHTLFPSKKQPQQADRVWQFKAVAVRDFAFSAGENLIWQTHKFELNNRWQRLNVAYPDNGRWLWHKYAMDSTRHSVQQLEQLLGAFPFASMNVVNIAGIGMEFPGLTFVGFRGPDAAINGPAPAYSRTEKHDVIGGIMHEVAHSYFPMLVNTDERREGFFDEGLVSFLSYVLEQRWSKDFQSFYGNPADVGPVMTKANYVAPVSRADHFEDKLDSHYHVPAVALVILRDSIIGQELFDATLKGFVRHWAGKRASFSDFMLYVQAETGLELDWFWRGWFYSANHVDLALTAVRLEPHQLVLTVQNKGGIVMPFRLELLSTAGRRYQVQVPVDIWRANNQEVRVFWPVPEGVTITQIELAAAEIADANPANNQLSVGH